MKPRLQLLFFLNTVFVCRLILLTVFLLLSYTSIKTDRRGWRMWREESARSISSNPDAKESLILAGPSDGGQGGGGGSSSSDPQSPTPHGQIKLMEVNAGVPNPVLNSIHDDESRYKKRMMTMFGLLAILTGLSLLKGSRKHPSPVPVKSRLLHFVMMSVFFF